MLWEYVILLRHYAKKRLNLHKYHRMHVVYMHRDTNFIAHPIKDRPRAPSLEALELERAATTKWRGSAAEVMAWSSWRIVLLPSEYLSLSLPLSSLHWFWKWSPHDPRIYFISEAYLQIDIWNCYQWSNPRSYYPYLNFQI